MSNSIYVDTTTLNELIQNQSWDEVLAQHDVNISCKLFCNAFENMRALASKQELNSTGYKQKITPWISLDLVKSIRKREKLSKLLKRQQL